MGLRACPAGFFFFGTLLVTFFTVVFLAVVLAFTFVPPLNLTKALLLPHIIAILQIWLTESCI